MSGRVRRIAMQSLTHCDVCCSGRHVEIGFTDHRGEPALMYVPRESLRRLLLALPAAAAEASANGAGLGSDATLPLADWRLRRDSEAQTLLLTLRRVDGLGLCYRLPAAAAVALAAALEEAAAPQDATAEHRVRRAGLRQ